MKHRYYKYFVSFTCKNEKGNAKGNTCYVTKNKIKNFKGIHDMINFIEKENNVYNTIIVNFILLGRCKKRSRNRWIL